MPAKLIKEAIALRRGAKVARRGSALAGLTGTGATRAAIREAEALGVGIADVGKVADRTKDVERRTQMLENVEQEFKRVASVGTRSAVGAVKAAGSAPRGGALSRLWATMSAKDRTFLLNEAIRLVRSGKDVHNNMAGVIREVVVKYLPDVRREVGQIKRSLRASAANSRATSILDTGARGPVHLPTRKLLADGRGIELGTDRLVGAARGSPQKVAVKWADGTADNVWVAGELDVALAIEVKGKTNARAGVTQLESLASRGGRGYAVIDGQFWLLKYDPTTVKHVVIAPPGDELAAARRALSSGKSVAKSTVIEIPKDFDGRIHGMADFFLKLGRAYVAAP